MFLSGNFLGVSPLIGKIDIIPPITKYDTFKFYGGNTGSTFSRIWGRNEILSVDEVNNYTLNSYLNPVLPDGQSVWQFYPNTYFLAEYENTLNAGNITGITYEVESWLLYRKELTSTTLEYMDTLTPENVNYYDFTVLNNKEYMYYVFVNDSQVLSNTITTLPIISSYYGWFLIDIENNRTYHFDINFVGGNNNFTDSLSEHKTNNRTNAFTRGSNFYLEGSLEAIISKDNKKKDLQYTNEDLLALADFIVSDRPKILKSRRGELFNVFTYGYQERLLNPSLSENIYVSSFSFKEVGDI